MESGASKEQSEQKQGESGAQPRFAMYPKDAAKLSERHSEHAPSDLPDAGRSFWQPYRFPYSSTVPITPDF